MCGFKNSFTIHAKSSIIFGTYLYLMVLVGFIGIQCAFTPEIETTKFGIIKIHVNALL